MAVGKGCVCLACEASAGRSAACTRCFSLCVGSSVCAAGLEVEAAVLICDACGFPARPPGYIPPMPLPGSLAVSRWRDGSTTETESSTEASRRATLVVVTRSERPISPTPAQPHPPPTRTPQLNSPAASAFRAERRGDDISRPIRLSTRT
eukprot:scaffold72023_cov31-Tisochrysis_lutea.AAC.5